MKHLASLAGLTVYRLASAALLSRGTLRSVEGNRITAETAHKVGAVTGGTPERQREIAGWLCSGAGEPPQEDEVRAALAASGVKA